MKTILIVDDEKEICRSLKGILVDEGYHVDIVHNPEETLTYFQEHTPHVVLLDVWFGRGSWEGVHFLDRLKQLCPLLPIIMISGHGTLELAVRAMKKGAYDFIEKPIDVDRLLLAVVRSLEFYKLKSHHLIVGKPEEKWPFPLSQKVIKAALSDMRMLLLGKRGTEKRRYAHAIHLASRRKDGPFMVLSANELNKLSSQEIWGCEVNGMVKEAGIWDYIQGGTLLIQHVHTLDVSLQQQFTKLFESGNYIRVDSEKSILSNVRFLFTAPQDFLEASATYGIRREFFDRIALSPLVLHCLQEKREYISIWVNALLEELVKEQGMMAMPTMEEDVMRVLQTYDWPGDVKELRNVLESALMVCEEEKLLPSHFSSKIGHLTHSFQGNVFSLPIQEARSTFEYNYLCAHIASANGNISHVAQIIGMERSALHRKLKTLKDKYKNPILDAQ